jgi:DNA ligase-4
MLIVRLEFNIQQIIKKDAQDILKPEWVSDSISVGKLQPFRRKQVLHAGRAVWLADTGTRYLFHATSQRVHDEEYGADDEHDERKDPMNLIDSDHDIKLPTNRLPQRDQSATSVKEEQDPAFASWFKVEPIVAPLMVADSETESDTDPESDNDDAHGDGDVLVNEDVWAMARPGHPESGLEEVVDAPSTVSFSSINSANN